MKKLRRCTQTSPPHLTHNQVCNRNAPAAERELSAVLACVQSSAALWQHAVAVPQSVQLVQIVRQDAIHRSSLVLAACALAANACVGKPSKFTHQSLHCRFSRAGS